MNVLLKKDWTDESEVPERPLLETYDVDFLREISKYGDAVFCISRGFLAIKTKAPNIYLKGLEYSELTHIIPGFKETHLLFSPKEE